MTSRQAAGPTPDASAPLSASSPSRPRRRLILFAAIGFVTYLLSLLATTPARLFVPTGGGIAGVGGTIWHGEAALTGGNRIEWRWAPLRSIAGFGFAADWRVTGAATDLGGRALLRRGAARLEGVSGRVDGSLLAALAPGLPFRCDLIVQADLPLLAIGGAEPRVSGTMRSEAGSCTSESTVAPLPPLVASAAGEGVLRVTPAGEPARLLAELGPDGTGTTSLRVTPAGAALLPFAFPATGARIPL